MEMKPFASTLKQAKHKIRKLEKEAQLGHENRKKK